MSGKLCAFFLIFGLLHLEVAQAIEPLTVMKAAVQVASLLQKVFNQAHKQPDIMPTLQKMSTEISTISDNLSAMGVHLREKLDDIAVDIPDDIQTAAQIDDDLRDIFDRIITINHLFKSYYLEYLNGQISNSSLRLFLDKAMNIDDHSPTISAEKIYRIICPGEYGVVKSKFLNRLVDQLNNYVHHRCKKSQSPQQFIYGLFTLISTVELRAFMMISTAYKVQSLISNDDHTRDIERIQEEHIERMRNYLREVRDALNQTTTEVSRCRPTLDNDFVTSNLLGINLLPKESDYKNNMVVSGIRFVVKNRMLHLQIEEAKLNARGEISYGTERWIPMDDVLARPYGTGFYTMNGSQEVNFRMNVDYLPIFWDYLLIETVTAPTNYVVVGANFEFLRLHLPDWPETCIFYLRLKYAEVDFASGQINPNSILYNHKLTYTTEYVKNLFDGFLEQGSSGNDEFVRIYYTPGHDKRVPAYMDSQALYTTPRLPLTGVSFYKNQDSTNGGSISLKIKTLDITQRIQAN